jgi:hypothetical protein
MNDKINTLKDKIQQLISQTTEKNNQQKELLSFLFTKLNEVKELETLENLKGYKNGIYLKAYLFYQSIKRANYQPEHLKLTKLDNTDKCLEMIEKDLATNQPKEPKELTDQQLLTLLAERLSLGKICLKKDKSCLFEVGKVGQPIPFKVFLDDGRIEPDPAQEFMKKHGIKGKK